MFASEPPQAVGRQQRAFLFGLMVGDPSGFSTLLSRSDILRNVLGLAAAGGSFRGGAAIAQIGYPALPPLSGQYDTIGCRYTRVNGYATQGLSPGLAADPRQVCYSHCYSRVSLALDSARAKIFYPASGPSSTEAPYCTDGRATSDGMAGLVGFRSVLEMPSPTAAPGHGRPVACRTSPIPPPLAVQVPPARALLFARPPRRRALGLLARGATTARGGRPAAPLLLARLRRQHGHGDVPHARDRISRRGDPPLTRTP